MQPRSPPDRLLMIELHRRLLDCSSQATPLVGSIELLTKSWTLHLGLGRHDLLGAQASARIIPDAVLDSDVCPTAWRAVTACLA
jgi:hypothetical protein